MFQSNPSSLSLSRSSSEGSSSPIPITIRISCSQWVGHVSFLYFRKICNASISSFMIKGNKGSSSKKKGSSMAPFNIHSDYYFLAVSEMSLSNFGSSIRKSTNSPQIFCPNLSASSLSSPFAFPRNHFNSPS